MSTIRTNHITKQYKDKIALKDVSLNFIPNKIYGLLGRNGAGKTTLINIITNKIFASEGEILIDEESAVENYHAQSKIFHMTVNKLYPSEMKVSQGFKWTKEFYSNFNLDYAYVLANKYELDINKRMSGLSTGYNTIFKLILALAAGTPIVIYDEPVSGLDANHRELFYKELISNYVEEPKTIILSTHLVEEISTYLEHVIIIKKGEIILDNPVEDILNQTYKVSGDSNIVDQYISTKNVIKKDTIGNLKIATIFQSLNEEDRDIIKRLGLDFDFVKLQDLVISLTNF